MTVHIGEIGSAVEQVDMTFGYFGEHLRVHPDANDMAFIDLLRDATGIQVDEETQQIIGDPKVAVDMLDNAVAQLVHPDDVERFWKITRTNRQGTHELMTTCERIVEAVGNFRSAQSSASSSGRTTTNRKSRRAGDKARRKRAKALRHKAAAQAAAHLQGRPDLGLALANATEALDREDSDEEASGTA